MQRSGVHLHTTMKPIGLEHETCYTEGINVYLCTTPRPLTHVWGNCVPLAWAQLHRKPGAFSAPWPSVAAHPCPHLRSLPEAAHHHHPCTIRLYILWHGAHALRLSVPVCALTESWAPLNALFARTENWRSFVAPVATLDLAIAVSSVKRPHACLRSHARARPTQSLRAIACPTQPPPLPAYNRVEACFRACRLDLCFACVLGRRYEFLFTRTRGVWGCPRKECIALFP